MDQQGPPFVIAGLLRGINGQTHVSLTLATVVVGALVIFVMAFLLGLCCGSAWQRRRR